MRRKTLLILFALLLFAPNSLAQTDTPPTTIAFGSCVKQGEPQPIWTAINATKPELFIFLGDNIYGDTRDMNIMRGKWNMLGAEPGFQALKAQATILATWDDHDYGVNDGGRDYPMRAESQQVFLDFFDEPADSPRRKQEGIYDAKLFGPEGQRVQVILLDTRYHRSPLKRGPNDEPKALGRGGTALPDDSPDATILGDAQWHWLEQQLKTPAEVRIIASSIQVIANEHRYEKWGNFPRERDRLFQLIKDTGANGVIFLSGDRHSAEISRLDPGIGYPLHDITASALNRPLDFHNELNPHRLGVKYVHENFGLITINWEKTDPEIIIQIRDINGEPKLQVNTSLSALTP